MRLFSVTSTAVIMMQIGSPDLSVTMFMVTWAVNSVPSARLPVSSPV